MNNKFDLLKPMAPPWLMYPEISIGSIGWRMGSGEYYRYEFIDWLDSLTESEQNKYQKMFPEQRQWKGFYNEKNSEIDYEEYLFQHKNYWIECWQPNGVPTYDYKNLIHDLSNDKKMSYLFFWGHQPSKDGQATASCLSQWWKSEFTIDMETYCCMEQFMMAEKARLFGDEYIRQQIMECRNPKQIKSLGRKVRDFDEAIWNKVKYSIVLKGNYNKFLQNDDLRKFLLDTDDRILVEASPYDGVWGIKMSVNDIEIHNPESWNGENLLGFALMEVRNELKNICKNYDMIDWKLIKSIY